MCDRGSGSRQPLEVARELAWRLRASITVLGVAVDAEEAEALGPRIKKRQNRDGLALAEPHEAYVCSKCNGNNFRVALGFEIPGDSESPNDTSWFALSVACEACGHAEIAFEDETA